MTKDNSRKQRFILAYSVKEKDSILVGRHGSKLKKLADHTYAPTWEAESEEEKAINSQTPSPGEVLPPPKLLL